MKLNLAFQKDDLSLETSAVREKKKTKKHQNAGSEVVVIKTNTKWLVDRSFCKSN